MVTLRLPPGKVQMVFERFPMPQLRLTNTGIRLIAWGQILPPRRV
jgi:hypothetical protein